MKLLVTAPQGVIRESFLPKQVRDRLESVAEVEYNTLSRNWTPEELRDRLHGVDVALTGWGTTLFDETVLAGADRLRLIAHTGGSVTPVMSDAAYDRGIRVISGNEMYAESVAESVIAYALTALRKIPGRRFFYGVRRSCDRERLFCLRVIRSKPMHHPERR